MAKYTVPEPIVDKPRRSNFNLTTVKRFTFAPGLPIPVHCQALLPGDTVHIDQITSQIESFALNGSPMGAFQLRCRVFFEPLSNLYGFMDNNTRMDTSTLLNLPLWTINAAPKVGHDPEGTGANWYEGNVAPGSLWDWLGVPVGFAGVKDPDAPDDQSPIQKEICAHNLLAYLDIIRTYYVNVQEPSIPCIGYAGAGMNGFLPVDLKKLDALFMALRSAGSPLNLVESVLPGYGEYSGDDFRTMFSSILQAQIFPLGGLFCESYKMDLNRGVLNANIGATKSVVNVQNNQFTIDSLRYANKLQEMIDRYDLSGGRFFDWLRTQWSVKSKRGLDIPEFVGQTSTYINFNNIYATTAGSGPEQSSNFLGEQGSFVMAKGRSQKHHFRASEYGVLVFMLDLVPIVDYCQGFEIETMKTKFSEIFSPKMANLGYQDVSAAELSVRTWGDLSSSGVTYYPDASKVVGKRVAWAEYMTNLNRLHGLFVTDLDFWTIMRQYTTEDNEDPGVYHTSYTTYVHPWDFNYLFRDNDLFAQNWRGQIVIDMSANRPIGKPTLPKL